MLRSVQSFVVNFVFLFSADERAIFNRNHKFTFLKCFQKLDVRKEFQYSIHDQIAGKKFFQESKKTTLCDVKQSKKLNEEKKSDEDERIFNRNHKLSFLNFFQKVALEDRVSLFKVRSDDVKEMFPGIKKDYNL